MFNFYTYLRTHPLLLRRHLGSSDKAKVGLTTEGRRADSISLVERRLFFTAAHAHLQAGCPMLALEVLSKMPKVHKRSSPLRQDRGSGGTATPAGASDDGNGGGGGGGGKELDWSQPVLNGYESHGGSLSNSRSESVLSFDWSQPSLTQPDESLELKWESDKEEDEDDGDISDKSGTAGNRSVFQSAHDSTSPLTEGSTAAEDGDDFLAPSDDISAAQLKFHACLKILTNELRTLSTGYELDGGKLRYQLCQWLEKEVTTVVSNRTSAINRVNRPASKMAQSSHGGFLFFFAPTFSLLFSLFDTLFLTKVIEMLCPCI